MDSVWESPVRTRLRESKPVFGCTITTTSLDVAARAARAGFDFLWLELEHEQGFLFFQAPSDLALLEAGAHGFLGPHGIAPARR
jgi:hypothetical protein